MVRLILMLGYIKKLFSKTNRDDVLPIAIICFGICIAVVIGLSKNNFNILYQMEETAPVAMVAPKATAPTSPSVEEKNVVVCKPTAGSESFSNKEIIDMLYTLSQVVVSVFSLLFAHLTKTSAVRRRAHAIKEE